MAFLSVVIFGVWPAWRTTRVDVVSALKSNAPGTIGRAASPARVLVMLQVALSLVLVTGTGLFVRSLQNLLDIGLGFEPERLLTVTVDPRLSGTPPEDLPEMYKRVHAAVVAGRIGQRDRGGHGGHREEKNVRRRVCFSGRVSLDHTRRVLMMF